MKLVLAGGYDTSNLGDHAMLYVLKNSLEKYEPVDITILARHLEPKIEKDYGVRLIKNLDHETKEESIGRWFNGFNLNDNTEHIAQIREELQEADALVIGGGRLLIDICLDFMKGPLPYFVLLVVVAKFLGKPIIIYGMTIVAPKTSEGVEMLKFIVENANLVMVREDSSKNTLSTLDIQCNNLHVIPDPAFALPHNEAIKNLSQNIFSNERLDKDKKYIGLNLRFTNLNKNLNQKEYIQKVTDFCDLVFEKYNLNILLISQMTYKTEKEFDDDRNFYKLIKKNSKYSKNIHILLKKYNVIETLSIYNNIEKLFSMRRHGLIFAATQNIPIYGLVAEENTRYALEEMNLEDNYIDFNKEFNVSMFDDLADENEIKLTLKKSIQELSSCSTQYANTILELLK